MSTISSPSHSLKPSTGVVGGVLYSLPYVALWMLTIYLNVKGIPGASKQPTNSSFNLILNFIQLVPPAIVAFLFGRRIAAPVNRKGLFRKLMLLTLCLVGYEIILILAGLAFASITRTLPSNFQAALWWTIPLFLLVALSAIFGLFHAVSTLALTVLIPKSQSTKL